MVTEAQAAFIIRNTEPTSDDFRERFKVPACFLCADWGLRFVNRSTVEKAGLAWPDDLPVDEDGEPPTSTDVWNVIDFGEPRFTPEDKICVVSRRVASYHSFAGLYVTDELAPVHLHCWYYEHLNGRRVSGLTERSCRHCDRAFFSRQALDWCHVCPKPERTCAHCTGPLRPDNRIAEAVGMGRQQERARSDAKYCSPACRVASHRERRRKSV